MDPWNMPKKKAPLAERLHPFVEELLSSRFEGGDEFSFRTPKLPSKKNTRQMVGRGKGKKSIPHPDALMAQKVLKQALEFHVRDAPLWADDDVAVTICFDPKNDIAEYTVRSLGPRNEEFYDRWCDIQNLIDVPLDAMQGSVYGDDRQVALLIIERMRSDEGESLDPPDGAE